MHKKLRFTLLFLAGTLLVAVPASAASVQELFNHYDTDGNGYYTKAELDAVYDAISASFDTSTNTWADIDQNGYVNHADYGAVEALKAISTKNMIDTNRDGSISFVESINALRRVALNFGKQADQAGFDPTADFDMSSGIVYSDYGVVYGYIEVDPSILNRYNALRRFDTNVDYSVSYEEGLAALNAISQDSGGSSTNPLADIDGNGFVNINDKNLLLTIIQELNPDIYDRLNSIIALQPIINPIENQTVARGSLLAVMFSGTGLQDLTKTTFSVTPVGAVYALGDVSMNGEISAYDSALILQYINNPSVLDEKQRLLADIDQDGFVTGADSQMVANISVGNIEFPGKYYLFYQVEENDFAGQSSVEFSVKATANGSTGTAVTFNVAISENAPATQQVIETVDVDLMPYGPIRITRNNRGRVGTPMTFRARIRNGGSETSELTKVKVEITNSDGTVIWSSESDMDPLRRRQSRYINFNWTADEVGQYKIRVVADSDNDIDEINEKNNVAELALFFVDSGESGAFAIKNPDTGDTWRTADRERIQIDAYGLLRRGGKYLLRLERGSDAYGPYEVTTRGSSIIYYTPSDVGSYKVYLSACDASGCGEGNSYYVEIAGNGEVVVEQNPRVRGVTDDGSGLVIEDGVYDDSEVAEEEVLSYGDDGLPYETEVSDDSVEVETVEEELENEDFVVKEASEVKQVDDRLVQRLRGRILLQVENRGEAWYLDPVTDDKFYLKNGLAAYNMFRRAGLGITNNDLAKIPVGFIDYDDTDSDDDGLTDLLEEALGTDPNDSDSDDDGYDDKTEVMEQYNPRGIDRQGIDNALINRLKGRILLQVEDRGQAWYINPVDGKRYLLSNGDQAYRILRNLSLGIKNSDLRKISVGVWE